MHLILCAEDSEAELRSELTQSFPGAPGLSVHPLLLETDFGMVAGQRLPHLVFARQFFPNAYAVRAESIRGWATVLAEAVTAVLPDDQPWSLHIEPHYGARTAHRMGARAWHSAVRHGTAVVQDELSQEYRRSPRQEARYSMRKEQSRRTSAAPGQGDALRAEVLAEGSSSRTPAPEAGRQRCRLIREALLELLQRKRRHLLRQLRREPIPFTANDSLVQLLLTAPEAGYLSVAAPPMPFEQRHLLSPFPKGEAPLASDKAAPSRAFAKLVEAERRLGRAIRAGETCVDLGASPGSWTYVAVSRGARVLAVDRSPLRDDLMRNRQVQFQAGDAFRFKPPRPVDWLLCDVIAAPERTAELLLEWLRQGWCRHFVVTVKLKDAPGADALAMLKRELPALTSELFLTRLCANKKEACAFGSV